MIELLFLLCSRRTVALMLSLSFNRRTAPWVLHTKGCDAAPEALNGVFRLIPKRVALYF